MIFEYTSIHKQLHFSCVARREANLSSGSIQFGIRNYDGNGLDIAESILVEEVGATQVSGSLELAALGLTEGKSYRTFFNMNTICSGSITSGDVFGLHMAEPVISTILDNTISGTSGSIGTQSLQTVCETGNTTNKDINCENLVATKNIFCNVGGVGTASITFDGLLGDQLTNDGTNFGMDNKLIIPISGSHFNTLTATNDVLIGNNLEVKGTIESIGNIESVASIKGNVVASAGNTMYINLDATIDSDSFLYFYEGAAQGAYLRWDNTNSRFHINKALRADSTIRSATNIVAEGSLFSYGDVYINYAQSDADSYIYFFENSSNTGASLMWDDSPGEFVFSHNVKITDVLNITPSATPGSAVAGDIYYDSTSNKLRCYNGTIWNDLY